jgi:outer membrane lipopolysaccharide assembly protein LptE/RlpB
MRRFFRHSAALAATALLFFALAGCGYHTLGAATHLPANVKTLSIPVFTTRTDTNDTERLMTEAVIREFSARTSLHVTPETSGDPDAILRGTILKESVAPLTYNASTQQSSSFYITLVISVTLTDRAGKVLYENKNYVYREQYQSTADLPTFIEENPAAMKRLTRAFARQLVADVIEEL